MKDKEKILAELNTRATDSEHEQALTGLCRNIIERFESESSRGVTDLLSAQMQTVRTTYQDAHRTLMEKLGSGRRG